MKSDILAILTMVFIGLVIYFCWLLSGNVVSPDTAHEIVAKCFVSMIIGTGIFIGIWFLTGVFIMLKDFWE